MSTPSYPRREVLNGLLESPDVFVYSHYRAWHETAKMDLTPGELKRYELIMIKKRLEE